MPVRVVKCVVEVPQGSRNKYEYDPDLGGIKLDRYLSSSVVYPVEYGFVPETLALDGDLPRQLCDEISHFFTVYKDLEPNRDSTVDGWDDREAAIREIEASRARFSASGRS